MAASGSTQLEPDHLSQGTLRWEVPEGETPWHQAAPKFYEGLYYSPGEAAKLLGDRMTMQAQSFFE